MKHCKKTLSVLLSLVMAFSMCLSLGLTALAADPAVIASGECGKDGSNLTWTLTDDGVLTISGTGEMADYGETYVDDEETGESNSVSVNAPWQEAVMQIILDRMGYESEEELEQALTNGTADFAAYFEAAKDYEQMLTSVVIEEGVTSVGKSAFNSETLTSVALPSTLKEIGEYAFYGCKLTAVTLPEGLETIGYYAFSGNRLSEVTVPASVTSLDSAFGYNSSLQTLTLLCDVPLNTLNVPVVEPSFPFTTYEAYADFQTFYEYESTLSMLLNLDAELAMSLPQYVIYYHMTEADARVFMNSLYTMETAQMKSQLGLSEDVTNEAFAAELVARINSRLGTQMTAADMYTPYPFFAPSCSLYTELYEANLTMDLQLAQGYLGYLLQLRDDYDGFIARYIEANDVSLEEAQAAISEELESLYSGFREGYGIEASSVQGLIDGLIAKINSDLGKTEENAYTVETAGTLYTLMDQKSAAFAEAIKTAFGLTDSDFYADVNSYEIASLTNNDAYVPAPWFTVRVKCDNTNTDALEAADISYELIHTLTPHDGKAATCTEGGWEAYETCEKCDYTTYEALGPLGHDIVEHAAKAPTCVAIGWDAYETCSRCDYTTYAEKAATGVHTWGEWVVTTPATATEDGVKTRTCTVCQTAKETDSIPATGTPSNPDTPDTPDQNEDGVCVCGKTHTGFFGKFITFFHRIIYFFKNLFSR